jgi:hypothetical protein
MDIRHNGQFYRTSNKTTTQTTLTTEGAFDVETATPANASSKILLTAYKGLMQRFNQLDTRAKNKWQLEINIIARQLTHLFKQAAKSTTYTGYPALSLLKEIKQLDEKIFGTSINRATLEKMS